MREGPRPWDRRASVTIAAAAELVNVDMQTIRQWSDSGYVEIEWRGDMEVVRLDRVEALAKAHRRPPRPKVSGLQGRLEGAVVREPDIGDLQRLVRERDRR